MTRNEAIRYLGDMVAKQSRQDGLSPVDSAIMFYQAMTALGVSNEEMAGVGTRAAAEYRNDIENPL